MGSIPERLWRLHNEWRYYGIEDVFSVGFKILRDDSGSQVTTNLNVPGRLRWSLTTEQWGKWNRNDVSVHHASKDATGNPKIGEKSWKDSPYHHTNIGAALNPPSSFLPKEETEAQGYSVNVLCSQWIDRGIAFPVLPTALTEKKEKCWVIYVVCFCLR